MASTLFPSHWGCFGHAAHSRTRVLASERVKRGVLTIMTINFLFFLYVHLKVTKSCTFSVMIVDNYLFDLWVYFLCCCVDIDTDLVDLRQLPISRVKVQPKGQRSSGPFTHAQ